MPKLQSTSFAFPSAKNSMGQMQRAWVVFNDEGSIWWLRWLRPGFRHCFVIINDDDHWIAIEPLASCLEVSVLPPPPDFNLPDWFRGQGHHVVPAGLVRQVESIAPLAFLNCVEVVKRVLGLRMMHIVTPYQLYRHLMRQLPSAISSHPTGVSKHG